MLLGWIRSNISPAGFLTPFLCVSWPFSRRWHVCLLPGFWKLSFIPHCKSFVVCLNMTPLLHSPFQLVNKLIFVITLNGDFCWVLLVCWLWLVISHEVRAAECSFLTHDWAPLRLCYPSEWISSRNDGADTIVIQFSVAGLLGYESLSGSWEG